MRPEHHEARGKFAESTKEIMREKGKGQGAAGRCHTEAVHSWGSSGTSAGASVQLGSSRAERHGEGRGRARLQFVLVRACLTPGKTQLLPWAAEPTLATSLRSDRAQCDPGGQRWENQWGKHPAGRRGQPGGGFDSTLLSCCLKSWLLTSGTSQPQQPQPCSERRESPSGPDTWQPAPRAAKHGPPPGPTKERDCPPAQGALPILVDKGW